MTTNTPPSPNFTGINFNLDFFPSAVGDFVEYPVAQGPTTIATLYSSVIDTLSSGTAFNFLNTLTANLNIATNNGGTVTIGSTASNTVLNGTSVKATTKLTTPILDCVADTLAGTTALAIGPTVSTGNIVIGAALGVGDVSIGGAQSVGGTITLGSANTVTTASNGLTLPSGKYITTSHTGTVTAPTSVQVGGIFNTVTAYTPGMVGQNQISSFARMTLPAGSWMVFCTRNMLFNANNVRALFSFGTNGPLTNATPVPATDYAYGISSVTSSASNTLYASLTTPISLTVATPIYLNITYSGTATGLQFDTTNAQFYAMRIA